MGDIHYAAGVSKTQVQAAIDAASDGDTVIVPAGSAEWNGPVGVGSEKAISIIGAGIGLTNITMNPYADTFYLERSASRVSGFSVIDGAFVAEGTGWRLDHSYFDCYDRFFDGGVERAVLAYTNTIQEAPQGLVDHCNFICGRILNGGWYYGQMAHKLWSCVLGLGTGDRAVYVEDCTFDFSTAAWHSNCIDANCGGGYVFRHNDVIDSSIDCHSIQATERATRKWEIYENTIHQVTRSMWVPFYLRGGTGVIFNNTITGTWTDDRIMMDNRRSCTAFGGGGLADGTSPWDGNTAPTETYQGWPARDQIGRSTDQWEWTPGHPYPPQASQPAYFWNNKHGGDNVIGGLFEDCSRQAIHIVEGRDYFDNTEMAGYIPYTYPHPLQGEDVGAKFVMVFK